MSGAAFSTSLEAVGLDEAIAKLMRLEAFDGAQLMDEAGALLESSTRGRFDTKVSPDGDAWEPWSERYDETRNHGAHSLLVEGGWLRDSIQSYATGTEARVGSNLVYAAIHQFGGEPVESNIPARPYLGISSEDEADLHDLVGSYVEELLH